ncbi:TIGR03279 family radical SAM protein [Prochlorococcus sp. MIT 1341]|uniref:TIGR03279 family radical SAM protein n=1 Tax=Prochlorococcus sp. MIT 1341 TaxID=3096221 RepID=UPI002A74EFA1|nr:TIGR03279 family radical SAM protein [Prochlorococcus sp. MIT 1341]
MWDESFIGIGTDRNANESQLRQPTPAEIQFVEKDSIGEEIGFEVGDKLISINGIRPRDLIDYQFLIVNEELHVEVISLAGEFHEIEIEKDLDESLGIAFTESLFDGLRQCNNQCPFCFIDQQPPGKRETLYLKDDDYRLSFLYGSYLTLTNLLDSDWQRIEDQRLSPLYVSVHATDSLLRARLLKNPRAGLFMEQLSWFDKRNLQIHAQIVVCPGLNDGEALEKTLSDLAMFAIGDWPAVLSAAVVPVGLTRFRPSGDELTPVDRCCALKVIKQVEKLQSVFNSQLGTRFAWLSDEWYLIAGEDLPPRASYEDYPQQENGVGSIRSFLEDLEQVTANLPKSLEKPKKCSWVVGSLVLEALAPVCSRLNEISGLQLNLHGLPSSYWGQKQVVTGLLTGADLLEGLGEQDLGDQLLLPSITLRQDEAIFLDDMTLDNLRTSLRVPIRIVNGAADIVAALIEE